MLRILGKYKDNKDWYFTDYCDTVYEVGHTFKNGERILEIKDQFLYNLNATSKGWKLICKIENLDDSSLEDLLSWDGVDLSKIIVLYD